MEFHENSKDSVEIFHAAKLIIVDGYEPISRQNDLGLIGLARSIKLRKGHREKIGLPMSERVYDELIFGGWGLQEVIVIFNYSRI